MLAGSCVPVVGRVSGPGLTEGMLTGIVSVVAVVAVIANVGICVVIVVIVILVTGSKSYSNDHNDAKEH